MKNEDAWKGGFDALVAWKAARKEYEQRKCICGCDEIGCCEIGGLNDLIVLRNDGKNCEVLCIF